MRTKLFKIFVSDYCLKKKTAKLIAALYEAVPVGTKLFQQQKRLKKLLVVGLLIHLKD